MGSSLARPKLPCQGDGRQFMKRFRWFVSVLTFCLASITILAATWDEEQQQAETLYAEGSFAKALVIYQHAPVSDSSITNRWIAFRSNDCLWRAQGGNVRNEESERALAALDKAFPQQTVETDRDRIWAEAMESLGDFHSRRNDQRDWVETRYGYALDWWAGRSELNEARARYLALIWKVAKNPWNNAEPDSMPVRIDWLNNAVQIAAAPNDAAHARYLRALSLRQIGPPDERALYLIEDDFKAAIAVGKSSPFYGAALFAYAQWVETQGKLVLPKSDPWYRSGDAVRALPLYQRLTTEFKEGENPFWRLARDRADEIVRQSLEARVDGVFLPGSEAQFTLNSRNLPSLSYTISAVDLTKHVDFNGTEFQSHEWSSAVRQADGVTRPLAGGTVSWPDFGTHEPCSTNIVLSQKLPPGAYLIQVSGGGSRSQTVILVSDATLTLHHSGSQVLAWFTDAITGEPIPEAHIHFWAAHQVEQGKWSRRSIEKNTDVNGIAEFDLENPNESLAVFARSNSRQAATYLNIWQPQDQAAQWKLYVSTDRPAYRPMDAGHWKLIARREKEGRNTNPAGSKLYYEIIDPRGARTTNGILELNAFGSAWGDFNLPATAGLGQYQMLFWAESAKQNFLGNAMLFRLEEYKLPEFEVKVSLPEETGPDGTKRKKAFKLGETVEIDIQADYYAGGPVQNANVEVLVHQSPWQPVYPLDRAYPWYYNNQQQGGFGGMGMRRWRAPDQILRRETLRTDATGHAKLLQTTEAAGNDVEFRIEARVTDESKREISGENEVRVTRQRYFVAAAQHPKIYTPASKSTLGFRAYDANHAVVSVTGEVTITRERWDEVWLNPAGKEVRGAELARLKRQSPTWPPRPIEAQRPWKLKFQGYRRDEIATQTVKIGTNGLAEVSFVPKEDGYYSAAWRSPGNATAPVPADGRPRPFEPEVTAESSIWVGTEKSIDLGYHEGGIQIVVESDTTTEGSRFPVAILADEPGRYILFAVDASGRTDYRVLHLTGTAQFLNLDIAERHVPNFFLSADSVAGRVLSQATTEIIVPPRKQFIGVEINADHNAYTPRGEGTYTVTTRDDTGKPVSAEVGLGVFDESVTYIQQDQAGDPRPFFYGYRRQQRRNTSSSIEQSSYLRLLRAKNGSIYNEEATNGGELLELEEASQNAPTRGKAEKNITPIPGLATSDLATGRFGGGGRVMLASKMAALGAPLYAAGRDAVFARDIGEGSRSAEGLAGTAQIVVRSDFRDTAFWQPDVHTGPDGTAQVSIKFPDSLTRWRATGRAVSLENQIGMGTNTVQTRQPLMVRLQTPRFLTVGDRCAVSAVIENQTDDILSIQANLQAEGAVVSGGWANGDSIKMEPGPVTVPSHGHKTVAWSLTATTNGFAKLRVTAASEKWGDAMERTLPIYEHGIEKLESTTGKALAGDAGGAVVIPAERKPGSTTFTVSITPSLAASMLDALPYLADYPYGCTEQTLSRFLPAVIIRQTLQQQGLDANAVMQHRFGGIETNSAAATHPGGKSDLANLDEMIKAGLSRLYDFQHADGGWGWWKEGESDPWMTAYVLWGWTLAETAGIKVEADRLNRAEDWLRKRIVEAENAPDLQAWELHALVAHYLRIKTREIPPEPSKAFDNLWARRNDLNAYSRALFATAAAQTGRKDETEVLLRNLENGVIKGSLPPWSASASTQETAHWGSEGHYYRWSEGGVEATAFALRALLAANPKHPLVEPVVTWLLKNRRGAQWNNTRDTAIVVLVLNDYLRTTGEAKPDLEYALEVNGQEIGKADLRGIPLWEIARQYAIPANLVHERNEFRVRRINGASPIYYSAIARYFSTEEPVKPAASELDVHREYVRLVGRPTLLKGLVYDRVPLHDGETVKSGDRVEAILTIAGQNNYEYLLFEDLKPGGFESAELRSGSSLYARGLKKSAGSAMDAGRNPDSYNGAARWVYPEWRDRKSALFIDHLPEGYWEIRVQYRAERPGKYHALPLIGQAMYVPEIRANSVETHLDVGD